MARAPSARALDMKELRRGGVEGEGGLVVGAAASWARGAAPVRDGEGVLRLGSRLSVACEESGQQAVGLRGEGVNCQKPAARRGELEGAGADAFTADRGGYLQGAGTGVVVDALVNKDAARQLVRESGGRCSRPGVAGGRRAWRKSAGRLKRSCLRVERRGHQRRRCARLQWPKRGQVHWLRP
jgi:hypothetical protein